MMHLEPSLENQLKYCLFRIIQNDSIDKKSNKKSKNLRERFKSQFKIL